MIDPSRTRQRERIERAVMGEPYFPPLPRGYQRDRKGVLVHPWQDHDPRAGTEPHDFSLDTHIARARAEMGEERWAELQKEWDA